MIAQHLYYQFAFPEIGFCFTFFLWLSLLRAILVWVIFTSDAHLWYAVTDADTKFSDPEVKKETIDAVMNLIHSQAQRARTAVCMAGSYPCRSDSAEISDQNPIRLYTTIKFSCFFQRKAQQQWKVWYEKCSLFRDKIYGKEVSTSRAVLVEIVNQGKNSGCNMEVLCLNHKWDDRFYLQFCFTFGECSF